MKHRSTTATVIGATLLLASIAGVATAAPQVGDSAKPSPIKKGSVTSAHIKDGTVQKKDLAPALRTEAFAPPSAFAAAPENSVNIPFDTDTVVVSRTLPEGAYVVQANLTLYSTQSGIGSCSLLVDSDSYNIAQVNFPTGGGRASISLSAIVFATPLKSPSVECWTPATGNASEIRLTAIEVDAAT